MFDELKEVLERNNRFPESYNVQSFKEIKRLKSLQRVGVYLEPKWTPAMELSCEYT